MNYKGMDKDMKCRGFQYEVGKEYETDKAVACECGFHACEYPLDVFNYYPPAGSRFFEVEQSGELSKNDDDSKVASTKIKIGAELNIAGLVSKSVRAEIILRLRALFHVVIQFVCHFPRQSEATDEAVHGALLYHQILGVDDPQHQLSFRLVQPLYELQVAGFNFLFGFYHRQRDIESVVQQS